MAAANPPAPLPRRIATFPPESLQLTTATSAWPSELKSPTPIARLLLPPEAKVLASENVPEPLPRHNATLPLSALAVTRSRMPSLLKSAVAIAQGIE
jgi:hypothetical protein